jgi:hypothetical protein
VEKDLESFLEDSGSGDLLEDIFDRIENRDSEED